MKSKSLTQFHWIFAHYFWNPLPSLLQKCLSYLWSLLFKTRISRHLIRPLCSIYKMDAEYLDQFQPSDGSSFYHNFQDFFVRKYKSIPLFIKEPTWPCEGYICHAGPMNQLQDSWIKGEKKDVRSIFGIDTAEIINDKYFSS